jgi:pantoate--beta-alanine ligase
MEILKSPDEFIAWRKNTMGSMGMGTIGMGTIGMGKIGFVPTMGALHQGHAALIANARQENEIVVLSIFVNPTQFNDKNDLQNYPKTWEEDLKIAQDYGADAIFYPQFEDIYPDNYRYVISENEYSKILCGASRPGHFDGVLTIVMKLLNIVRPNRAYFGQKDFQQLTLIKGMIDAFFMDIEIIAVPIVREASGLALSSRNIHLSDDGRKIAPKIYEIIKNAKSLESAKKALLDIGFKIDYLEEWQNRRLVAVKTNLTKTGNELRLIDNVEI